MEPIKIDGCLLLAFCYQAGGFRKFSTDCIESLEVLDAYCTKLKDDDNDDVEGSNEDIQNNDKNIQNNKDANEDSQRDDIDELAFRMISIYRNVHREDGKANTIIDMALAEIMADCYEESKEYLSLDDFGKLIKLRSKFNIDIK
ncbi:MAG: hypothetical protein RR420_00950 [Anaerovoracaceae bacterium]